MRGQVCSSHLLLVVARAVFLGSEFQVSIFTSKNRVAQLYPQGTGCIENAFPGLCYITLGQIQSKRNERNELECLLLYLFLKMLTNL
jgi:hypothetical protein